MERGNAVDHPISCRKLIRVKGCTERGIVGGVYGLSHLASNRAGILRGSQTRRVEGAEPAERGSWDGASCSECLIRIHCFPIGRSEY